jgi:hypothetical protein
MDEHKKTCMDMLTQFIRHAVVGSDSQFNITGDESWFHNFDPEMKQQSMEWHHMTSRKKKARTVSLASNVMENASRMLRET